jgi:hypothetical protein
MANDDISKKKAPKRDVVEVTKVGQWGQGDGIKYIHRLACGHTEIRKRIAPANQMACTWCVVAEAKEADLRQLVAPRPVQQVFVDVNDIIDGASDDLISEQDAMRLQGSLASALRIPSDSIDVVLEDIDGTLTVSYALVFLSAADAKRLATKDTITILDAEEATTYNESRDY